VYQVAIAFQVLQVQQVQAVEGSFEWWTVVFAEINGQL
jgi:hypothetical protein